MDYLWKKIPDPLQPPLLPLYGDKKPQFPFILLASHLTDNTLTFVHRELHVYRTYLEKKRFSRNW